MTSFNEFRVVRASDNGREITGWLALWGNPKQVDAYGTYFDKNNPPELGLLTRNGQLVPFRLLYEHGMDTDIGRDVIGMVTNVWTDNRGIRFAAELDTTSPHYARVMQEIRDGKLATSSASADHLADFDSDGRFKDWLLSELSLTANPAEERMPRVAMIRAANGYTLDYVLDAQATGATEGAARLPGVVAGDALTDKDETDNTKGRKTMPLNLKALGVPATATLEEVVTAVKEALGDDAAKALFDALVAGKAAPADKPPEGGDMGGGDMMMSADGKRSAPAVDPMIAFRAELDKALTTLKMTQPVPQPVEFVRTEQPQMIVAEPNKYRHLSDHDLAFAYQVIRARGKQPSPDFMQVLGGRAETAIAKSDPKFADVRSAIKGIRAGEIAISTAAGGGDEWVAINWETGIWEKARANRMYQQLISKGMRVVEVPQGTESTYIMLEGADPTVYTIAQNADVSSGRPQVNVTTTRIGTDRALLTPGELGMAVQYSDVFEEDSFVPVAAQYNYQMSEKAEETIEQLMLNGDTETGATGNINLVDAQPASGLTTPYYIASNGLLKYALVTGSGTSRDGGALDENDFRLTLKLFPYAIRTRKQNIAFVVDGDTENTALNILSIKTDDVRKLNGTITSGVLTSMYGVDVYTSGFMALANTAGKVSNTANNNTLGRILAVYAPYWAMGWKRRIKIETDRDILSGVNIIVAKMRVGLLARGAGASVCSYNLTIA